jgi:cyanophycinase
MKILAKYIMGLALFCWLPATGQKQAAPKGKLFIIGGGDRSPALMRSLIATAAFRPKDYVVVLPMSSESPDTAFYYFKTDLEPFCSSAIVNFNFTTNKVNDKNWLDSLEHARLIFITGGDQDRFMKSVLHTPVFAAIHKAYKNGATIGGTSAGAAVMSQYMITGTELTDTTYHATFRKVVHNNIEIKEGLGLLIPVIIDQHFIVRSRYNRLLSALARYPSYCCIGIDEATAIIVQGNKVTVAGESQVIVMRKPTQLKITSNGLIKMKDIQFSIYTSGDEFLIDPQRKQ